MISRLSQSAILVGVQPGAVRLLVQSLQEGLWLAAQSATVTYAGESRPSGQLVRPESADR